MVEEPQGFEPSCTRFVTRPGLTTLTTSGEGRSDLRLDGPSRYRNDGTEVLLTERIDRRRESPILLSLVSIRDVRVLEGYLIRSHLLHSVPLSSITASGLGS